MEVVQKELRQQNSGALTSCLGGHMVFHRSTCRLFPDPLPSLWLEDEKTENLSVIGLCPVVVQGLRTEGSEMPGELTYLMALSFCVSERSPGKYSGWEWAVGVMARCTGFCPLI